MADDSQKNENGAGAEAANADEKADWITNLLHQKLNLDEDGDKPEQLLEEVTLEGIANYIKSGKCKNIITMAGAGISTSAGIPDFRSPGTGLYDNLQKYNLSSPQDIFDIGFFKENPQPFFDLAKELWPGIFKPTPCHYFIRLLSEKGLLLRHFTQNIDTLERVANVEGEKIVEAHGTFHSCHCVECKQPYTKEWIKDRIFADEIPRCTLEDCVQGLVKPDIVFFGEQLPVKFFQCAQNDLPACDLLIVMGTSLVVQPFASLCSKVPETTPRLYINLEKTAGSVDPIMRLLGMGSGFAFDEEDNYRDVFHQSTCDEGCMLLAEKLGWKEELEKLISEEHAKIEEEITETKADLAKLKVQKEGESNVDGSEGTNNGNPKL